MSEANDTETDEPPARRVRVHLRAPDADPPLTGWLDDHTAKLMRLAGIDRGEIDVVLVDDHTMRRLHHEHLGIAETTDVLTFDMRDHPGDALRGDVVVCLDQAARQAATRGHDTRLEALLYTLHGLLHLIGYDDKNQPAAAEMHRREDQLLSQAGFGPVYERQPTPVTHADTAPLAVGGGPSEGHTTP
jgi:probable rRNA maturation factor